MLCGLLAGTDVAGSPGSHFHAPSLGLWLHAYDLADTAFGSDFDALRAVFDAAMVRGRGGTEVFGLRMQRGSLDHFKRQLERLVPGRMSDPERIGAVFGPTLYVHLSRPDRLDQAISRVRTEQTGLWHRNADGTELERLAPPREPRYDAEAIERHVTELATLDDAWERWFAQQAVEPFRVDYDTLSRDPQGVLAELLSALGLDPARAGSVETLTAKLADAQSRAWRKRFQGER